MSKEIKVPPPGQNPGSGPDDPAEETPLEPRVILWVSGSAQPMDREALADLIAQGAPELITIGLDNLTPQTLDDLAPSLIMSTLYWAGGDAMDVADRLCVADFKGSYRIVTTPLPDPDIVRQEISTYCPKLDMDLLVLPFNRPRRQSQHQR